MLPEKKFRKTFFALLLLLATASGELSAQVWEDFSDGNFTDSPTWVGDTGNFRVNSNKQLQLNADTAGQTQLSFAYPMPQADSIVWEFWLRLAFSPTANNSAVVALYSDSADLLTATHYLSLSAIDPSISGKNISLYQDDSLILTVPFPSPSNNNKLRFRVILARNETLTLDIDSIGDADSANYTLHASGTAVTSLLPSQAYFGIYCLFTASRSKSFYLDEIGINKPLTIPDSTTPTTPTLKAGDILVNEILFNPPPGGADYVELYNNSSDTIPLSMLRLGKMDGDSLVRLYSISEQGFIATGDLQVVTTDANFVKSNYNVKHPEKMSETSTMPSYNDASGTVAVFSSDTLLLDRLDYIEKMHSRLLHDREGVALERRSTEAPTQSPSNWYSASSASGFGTPTWPNSQSREFLFIDNDFAVSPTLFSPDGDGYNDLLDISWSLELCGLSADITVYDSHGRTVRHLARGELLGCHGMTSWDGTDDSGNRCPRGRYIVTVNAYNESGDSQSCRRTVSLVRQ